MLRAPQLRGAAPPSGAPFKSTCLNARQLRGRLGHRQRLNDLQAVHAQTQPSFTCDVFKLQGLGSAADLQLLWRAARLHSEAFHEPPEALPFLAPITSFTYSLRSFSLQLLTYFMQGMNHITVMAYRPGQATGSSSSSSSSSSTPDALLQQQCVGTANVSLRLADTGFCEAIDCKPGTPFIIVTNMAVSGPYQGKGIGRQLMASAIDQALAQFKPSAELLVLMVYADNEVALGLYRSFGFIDTRWVDPRWLSDAERSRVGKQRRLLLVKKVQQGKL